jgi:nicotinamidase-related amidase
MAEDAGSRSGSSDLAMPEALRGQLKAHLAALKEAYRAREWAGRVGFGARPAVIVIDLARYWLDARQKIGSNLDPVLDATRAVLRAARGGAVPIFFTTFADDPAHPPSPHDKKLHLSDATNDPQKWDIDPRLERRASEKIVRKRYASAFKGTNLLDMLTMLRVDTLIVTGVSTSHCVYATCRDATDCFHVIVPREAVGERCELMHEVFLHDIDVDLGDVMALEEVTRYLEGVGARR